MTHYRWRATLSPLNRALFTPPRPTPLLQVEVSGVGFEVEGGRTTVEVGGVKQDVNLNSVEAAPLRSMLEVGCICNNATLTFSAVDEGKGAGSGPGLDAPPDAAAAVNIDASPRPATAVVNGQATEAALLVAAAKCGVADLRQRAARLHEVAFSSERKRMEVRCRLDASVSREPTPTPCTRRQLN